MKEDIERQFQNQEAAEKLSPVQEKRIEREPSFVERIRERFFALARNIKREQQITKDLTPEDFEKVEPETNIVEISVDVAREMALNNAPLEESVAVEQKLGKVLEKGESVAEKENPFEFLASVRLTDHLPTLKNGKLLIETPVSATNGDIARPTLHFAINEKVGSHAQGDWESSSYAILAPMDKMVAANGLPYGFGKLDTYWLVDEGVVLPDGTNILVRKDRGDDPRLQQLKEFCEKEGKKINFVEIDNLTDNAVNGHIKELGYGEYGAEKEDDQIRKKFNIETGGYGAHNNSWLHTFERTFMHGNPKLESSQLATILSYRVKERLALFTPGDQLYELRKNVNKLPEGLHSRYESITASRLNSLLDNQETAKAFFRAHLEIPETESGEEVEQKVRQAESKMFGQVARNLFDGSEFGQKFAINQTEVYEKFTNAVIDRIGKKEYVQSETVGEGLFGALPEVLENIPEELRGKILEKVSAVGGLEGVTILHQAGEKLTDAQKTMIKEGVIKNPEAFKARMSEESFQYLIKDVQSEQGRKFYDALGLGTEFIDSVIKTYGKE